jgi:hypothetical protein
LFIINCGIMQVLKWILDEETMTLIIEKIEWTNVETKRYEIEATIKNFLSTTKFGYVLNGRKRRF